MTSVCVTFRQAVTCLPNLLKDHPCLVIRRGKLSEVSSLCYFVILSNAVRTEVLYIILNQNGFKLF